MDCVLVRGLPGSGKSTFAESLGYLVLTADDYFTDFRGVYNWDPTKLPEAHELCIRRMVQGLEQGRSVAVANVFQRARDIRPYYEAARECDARIFVVDLFDARYSDAELAQRCTHSIGAESISRMRMGWER